MTVARTIDITVAYVVDRQFSRVRASLRKKAIQILIKKVTDQPMALTLGQSLT